MLELDFAELTDVGRIRDHNEDFLGHALPESPARARSHGWLFALADGVGGHEQGEVASSKAVDLLISGFRNSSSSEQHAILLKQLIMDANARVYDEGRAAGPGGVPMATTVVACALRFDRAVVANVGDSRCYLVRRGKPKLVTRDHTVAADQVRLGLLSEKEALTSPNKHILSRSLGMDLFVNVDTTEVQLMSGDILLLCSDGLHGGVSESEIGTVLAHGSDLHLAAQKLVSIANQRDGNDNISVQLIRIRGVEPVGMYRGRPYKLR